MLINNKEVKTLTLDGKQKISYFACTCSEKDQYFWDHELDHFKIQEGIECDKIPYGLLCAIMIIRG